LFKIKGVQRVFKQFTLMALALLPVACSTSPSALPTEVDGTHAMIQLGAPGQIVVRQTFRQKRDNCKSMRDPLQVSVRHYGVGELPMTVTCDDATGILLAQTTGFHPAGEYSLTLPKNRRRYSAAPAKILVRYRNADFASGEDLLPLTAEPVEPGIKYKGDVHYHAGDQTDWLRMKGKNASVNLVFMPEGDGAEAEVFSALPGNSGVRKLGTLTAGTPRTFALGSDDVLVRVRAKEMSGGTSYSLIRRDSEAKRQGRVQVVDCYPIGSGMGMAVLKIGEGIQVNDGVVISASDAGGKRRTLGKCTVTSVNGTEASCELPYTDGAEWVDFRAEGVFSGGKA
jgi:hypothetical protein